MMKFKRFAPGYTDEEISAFTNSHIILRDMYQENGSALFFYKELTDLGKTPVDFIETLDRAVTKSQTMKYDAERGLVEVHQEIADLEEKVSNSSPNDGETWKNLQAALTAAKNQKTMHEKTIEGADKEMANLTESHVQLLKQVNAPTNEQATRE